MHLNEFIKFTPSIIAHSIFVYDVSTSNFEDTGFTIPFITMFLPLGSDLILRYKKVEFNDHTPTSIRNYSLIQENSIRKSCSRLLLVGTTPTPTA